MTISAREKKWFQRIEKIDFAFQPIVNIHTGYCYGYEALLRNYVDAGFESIDALFDVAFEDGLLHRIDIWLREKAVEKFSSITGYQSSKLFFNLDNRLIDSGDYKSGNTLEILNKFRLPQDALCFEISEKHKLNHPGELVGMMNTYKGQGFKIAMDDYGVGFSGLQMLYYSEPDLIKIDRFFIKDIKTDYKKRLFVSNIVELANLLGITVVAEGVETESEYYICRDIGCNLIQGYFVQRPEQDIGKLKAKYEHVEFLSNIDRRYKYSDDRLLIESEIEYIEPVRYNTDLITIIEVFRRKKDFSFFPVVNFSNEPVGIIREKSLKDYTYSRYGQELLLNPTYGKDLDKFVSRFPVADNKAPVEKILEIYNQNENLEGILILDNMKYAGFLSSSSLLKILNEKNLAKARDENPLTKLSGNTMIYEYVSHALQDTGTSYVLVYFDFDNFKPFNDKYGFRTGDRVILMFADMLRKWALRGERFAGYIGGDDFYLGIRGEDLDSVYNEILRISEKFRADVEGFYDAETREAGHILSRDRSGKIKAFPLLTVSSALLALSDKRTTIYSTDEMAELQAILKKRAKADKNKVAVSRFSDDKWDQNAYYSIEEAV